MEDTVAASFSYQLLLVVNNEEKLSMNNKQSPLQIVKEKFGSKEKLIESLTGVLQLDEGESKEELAKRLKYVANAKLLHLSSMAEEVKALGGRDALVTKISELKGQAKDSDFIAKLKTYSNGRLADLHKSLSRKAKA